MFASTESKQQLDKAYAHKATANCTCFYLLIQTLSTFAIYNINQKAKVLGQEWKVP